MAVPKYTPEICEEILAYQRAKKVNMRECAEHFKYDYKALAQGIAYYKKKNKNTPKRAYAKKAKPLNLPVPVKPQRAHRMLEIEIQEPLVSVAVAMVPMQHLKQFLAAVCQ